MALNKKHPNHDSPEKDIQVWTQAINTHGIFFKKAVREKIEQYQDDDIKIVDEECPVAFPDQTSIDLVVAIEKKDKSSAKLIMIIECKRAYAKKKSWVFFKGNASEENMKITYHMAINEHYQIKTKNDVSIDLCPYSDGIEIDLGKMKDPTKGGNCDSIYKAASQVCKGYLGYLQAQSDMPQKGSILSIPVIITTAPLFSCENDFQDIDLKTGNLHAELELKPQHWIALRHPYSNVQGDNDYRERNYHDISARSYAFKETVYIVNSEHIDDFFKSDLLIKLKNNFLIPYSRVG